MDGRQACLGTVDGKMGGTLSLSWPAGWVLSSAVDPTTVRGLVVIVPIDIAYFTLYFSRVCTPCVPPRHNGI